MSSIVMYYVLTIMNYDMRVPKIVRFIQVVLESLLIFIIHTTHNAHIIGVRKGYIIYYFKNGATRIFLKNILSSSAHGYINFQ